MLADISYQAADAVEREWKLRCGHGYDSADRATPTGPRSTLAQFTERVRPGLSDHKLATKIRVFAKLNRLTNGRLGRFDVACPLCGPYRRAPINQRRPVLRVWRSEAGFATFLCVRCGEKGWARDTSAPAPDPSKVARARAAADERERGAAAQQLSKARWLWSKRQPIAKIAFQA
jgi:hypothetical protein